MYNIETFYLCLLLVQMIILCYDFIDGTVGTDISLLVSTFSRGMDITVKKVKPTLGYADEPDYGFCEATIGRLDMDADKLEDNLTVIINSLNEKRPHQRKDKDETFLTRCILNVLKLFYIYTIHKCVNF